MTPRGNRLKILVISHLYPSTFAPANGTFVHQQVKELIRQGCQVKVVSPVKRLPFPINRMRSIWRAYSHQPQKTSLDGIDVCYPGYLPYRPRALFLASSGNRMYKGIKPLIDRIYREFNFDLIHAHTAIPDGYAAIQMAQDYGKPVIVTIHGADLLHTIHRNIRCFNAVKKVFLSADTTITVGDKLKIIGEDNFHSGNIVCINNGINPGDAFVKTSGLLEKYRNKKIVLSVSALIKIKGIDLNLRAIQKLIGKYPELHYIIIGEGRERQHLEEMSEHLKISQYVEFVGVQPHERVMEYVSICDIFSLPSWREAFGVVYLEAMVHGKPVIGCIGQGVEDVIEPNKTGLLVEPRNVESLVDALDFLLSQPETAKAIGENSKAEVLEHYTLEKSVAKTLEIYERAIVKNQSA
jgi:teichuronic acid biosynthesis glycosyltransferase TuaC